MEKEGKRLHKMMKNKVRNRHSDKLKIYYCLGVCKVRHFIEMLLFFVEF